MNPYASSYAFGNPVPRLLLSKHSSHILGVSLFLAGVDIEKVSLGSLGGARRVCCRRRGGSEWPPPPADKGGGSIIWETRTIYHHGSRAGSSRGEERVIGRSAAGPAVGVTEENPLRP